MRPAHLAARSVDRCAAMLLFVLATTGTPTAAQTVQRCEGADGKVTYSNSACPDGTKAVRQVNTTPPIAVDEQKAAKDRAKRDAAAAKDAEKARDKERERCERAKRDLERARSARASLLQQRAATIDEMQKADREISKREAEATKACPG